METRTGLSRRTFFFGAGVAATSLALKRTAIAWPRSDEVRIAVIGVHGRGRDHVDGFRKLPGVRLVAVCDVDQHVLAGEIDRLDKAGVKVEGMRDARELFKRKDIDAVSIATPNHWHALLAVWACQAGKDVYVEKPVSHSVWEGRQIVRAAQKYERIVQTGTQCRSSEGIAEAFAWVREGHLGKIQLARGLCYKPRASIGKVDGPQTVPEWIDYDMWSGPAQVVPLRRKSLHYDWHWVNLTGNGDLGNQGVHQMDLARWALGESGLPNEVISIGGRLGYVDDGETPNTQIVVLGYERAPLVFEVRGLPHDSAAQKADWGGGMDAFKDTRIGVVVHCENGWLRVPDYESAQAYDAAGKEVKTWKGASDHFANFIDAVRSRKRENLHADIEEGHVSAALCHVGNVSQALGAAASPDQLRAAAAKNAPLSESLERVFAHLTANGIDLAKTPLTLGRKLRIDRERERFIDDAQADRLLKREYREPYTVPAV
jgi:predicted dehydrogenase